jgi:hypothetical protein
MRAPKEVLAELEHACRALAEGLSWEWDGRFSVALAVTRDPEHHDVLARVATQFPFPWDAKSIRDAPERLVTLINGWGGLRPGQQMFTRDPGDDPLLYAVWWPWGGNTTFSLRVACDANGDEAAALDPLATLRSCFGV